jgi:hypothetical protein
MTLKLNPDSIFERIPFINQQLTFSHNPCLASDGWDNLPVMDRNASLKDTTCEPPREC